MEIVKNFCPKNKYKIKCPYKMKPKFITIHNTANDASARNEIKYMLSNNNKTSYHYAVDDKEAIQAIPLNRNAWHAGDGNGRGNRESIGIEICYSKSGGKRFNLAEKNAAHLTAILLKRLGLGIDRVKRHKDWSGKDCPHRTIDRGWERFFTMVKKELEKLNTFKLYVKADNAPVRTEPKNTAQKVDILQKGTKVNATKKVGNWYKIGTHRWIHAVRVKVG